MERSQGNMQLIQAIIEEMKNEQAGTISFRKYMELCLYHPIYGYYMNSTPKVGREGDFYTSASIGTLMGEMLAVSFARYWQAHPPQSDYLIVEWGGGTGRLANQVLDELQCTYPQIYAKVRYQMIDTSAYHRGLQAGDNGGHGGHKHKIEVFSPEIWQSNHSKLPERSIIFANELLDAFSVHRIQFTKGQFKELHVGWAEELQKFTECLKPIPTNSELDQLLQANDAVTGMIEGQWIEINPEAPNWISSMAAQLKSGIIIVIDYGDLEQHLFSTRRALGTLMCYYRHQAHDNPYVNVGKQDITAHVNFSDCMRAAKAAGITESIYETQQQFLIRNGIMERLQSHQERDPFHPIVKRNRAIRQLLIGDNMGDVFKVLTLTRNAEHF